MKLTLATKAGKLPVQDTVRALLIEHVLPVLLAEESKPEFYQGKGENQTLGQDTFFVEIANDEGVDQGRVMFSWCPNVWGPKSEKAAKGAKNSAMQDDRIPLVPKELAALDAAIATMKAAGDIDNAVRLATIKSVASQSENRVSRADYAVVLALQG
jgi:hypothetical protein